MLVCVVPFCGSPFPGAVEGRGKSRARGSANSESLTPNSWEAPYGPRSSTPRRSGSARVEAPKSQVPGLRIDRGAVFHARVILSFQQPTFQKFTKH